MKNKEGYMKISDLIKVLDEYRHIYNTQTITDGVHRVSINSQLLELMDNLESKFLSLEVPMEQPTPSMNITEVTDPNDKSSSLYINLDKTITFHPKSGTLQLDGLSGPIKLDAQEVAWVKINLDKLRLK